LNSGRPVFDTSILVDWSEIMRVRKPVIISIKKEASDRFVVDVVRRLLNGGEGSTEGAF
jgi:hypothetical protein